MVGATKDSSDILTSIGIDIGTTTTQVVISDLTVRSPSYTTAERVEITDRTIRYRGPVHETPFSDPQTVDTTAVTEIVDAELQRANLTPEAIDTGAVIATGEAAETRNAEPLVSRLADQSGEFVVATAGASLEAILTGRGAGIATQSQEADATLAAVDIGGGTTNIAVFTDGAVEDTRCIDIGGRLLRFTAEGSVTHRSDPVRRLDPHAEVTPGTNPSMTTLHALATRMADCVFDAIEGPPFRDRTRALAIGDLPDGPVEIDAVVFTGGVGRLVSTLNTPVEDWFPYGDFGVVLAAAIRDHDRFGAVPVESPAEDIRATVIGVGTRTTTFSGRTAVVNACLLPQYNLPVVTVPDIEPCHCAETIQQRVATAMHTAQEHYDGQTVFALYIDDIGPLTYDRIELVARGIVNAYKTEIDVPRPLIVLIRQNCAKALGQTMRSFAADAGAR